MYSLDQHGISLNTLYTRCDAHTGSTLVVIRDAGDAVFGAWMGEGVHPHRGGYYGSGESYVCPIRLFRTSLITFGVDSFGDSCLTAAYAYTNGLARTTTSRSANLITSPLEEGESNMSGAHPSDPDDSPRRDGHYGLYLDDALTDGSSAPCPTFNNEPLCSAGPRQGESTTFECVGLEVWGIG